MGFSIADHLSAGAGSVPFRFTNGRCTVVSVELLTQLKVSEVRPGQWAAKADPMPAPLLTELQHLRGDDRFHRATPNAERAIKRAIKQDWGKRG
jgi:hypothetical protein